MTIAATAVPTLVLLNGITRPAESWQPISAALPDRAAIAFDGISAGPSGRLSVPEQARRVLARMDAEGVAEGDVIGFSHGGLVAQQLAIVAPQRVRRLVLLATSCGVGATAPALPWMPGSWPAAAEVSRPDLQAVSGQLVAISSWSSIPFLGGVSAPTLVIHGRDDRLVPVENGRLLARRIPGATLVELDCGHDLQRPDRAVQVAALIREFLA